MGTSLPLLTVVCATLVFGAVAVAATNHWNAIPHGDQSLLEQTALAWANANLDGTTASVSVIATVGDPCTALVRSVAAENGELSLYRLTLNAEHDTVTDSEELADNYLRTVVLDHAPRQTRPDPSANARKPHGIALPAE